MYLIDHHHLALALHRQGVTHTYIQVGGYALLLGALIQAEPPGAIVLSICFTAKSVRYLITMKTTSFAITFCRVGEFGVC
jgi:hypothetical protein